MFSSVELSVHYKGGHTAWGKKAQRLDKWPEIKGEAERHGEAYRKAWSSVTTEISFVLTHTCPCSSIKMASDSNTAFDTLT